MTIAVYPTLPGLSWDVVRTEVWSTTTIESASGRRYAQGNWTYPKRRFTLNYEFLRQKNEEFSQLVGFFNARKGSLEPFFWLDPVDYAATNQVFGTGDGSTKKFQLARSFGGSVEPVFGKKSITSVTINGTATTAYTVTDNCEITFTSAPANGAILRWTGEFYQYVVFADELETSEFAEKLMSGTVDLETVKL